VRIEPSGEQNQGEGDNSQGLSKAGMVKLNSAGTLRPRQHADEKEEKQCWHTEPTGGHTGEYAQQ